MKRVVVLLLFCIYTLSAPAQLLESRSGFLAFNISNRPAYHANPANSTTAVAIQGDNEVVANDKFNLSATVQSSEPIKKVMIFRNDSFINGYLSSTIKQMPDGSASFEELIPLKLGINDIKIEAYTAKDTVVKNIIVEYNLYAARNYALLVGNDKYNDPLINDLDKPVRDVEELYNILSQEYNFNPEDIIVLKNETKENIIGTLHKLRSTINPEDNLLIFYAGHGIWDEGMGVGYWLPQDAAKDNPSNWIPNTDLTNYLGAIKAKHTLLIADACFSGGIFKTRSATNASYAIEQLYQYNSRKAITSGTLTIVPDNSVFFQYLAKYLKENTNDYLTAEELFSNMRMAVINNSENIPQFGTIQNVGDEGGDFIFIKKR